MKRSIITIAHFFKVLLIIGCTIFIISCSRVNEQNYARIQAGMSFQEVVAILGNPTSTDSLSFGGLSGTSATWKHKGTIISIQFLNDKVQIKSLNKEGDKSQEFQLQTPPAAN